MSENKLTITAEKAPASAVSITTTKNGSVRKGVVVWSDGVITPGSGIQDLTTFTAEVNDPVKGYLNIKVSVGSAKIVKTSEDGKIDGITFTITGNGILLRLLQIPITHRRLQQSPMRRSRFYEISFGK